MRNSTMSQNSRSMVKEGLGFGLMVGLIVFLVNPLQAAPLAPKSTGTLRNITKTNKMLIAGYSKNVYTWNTESGNVEAIPLGDFQLTNTYAGAMSPDGLYAYLPAKSPTEQGTILKVGFIGKTLEKLNISSTVGPFNEVEITPDGKYLIAITKGSGELFVVKVSDNSLALHQDLTADNGASVVFSKDSIRAYISFSKNGIGKLVELKLTDMTMSFLDLPRPVAKVAFMVTDQLGKELVVLNAQNSVLTVDFSIGKINESQQVSGRGLSKLINLGNGRVAAGSWAKGENYYFIDISQNNGPVTSLRIGHNTWDTVKNPVAPFSYASCIVDPFNAFHCENGKDDTISIINTATETKVGEIDMPYGKQDLVASKDGKFVYASQSDSIGVINTTDNSFKLVPISETEGLVGALFLQGDTTPRQE